jgi:hypothetical protein
MDCLKATPSARSSGIEDGLDGVAIGVVGAVALDRIRDEVRSEPDHPGTGVLAALLIEPHRQTVRSLEQCRHQEADGSCAEDVHSASGTQGLEGFETGLRVHPPPC